MEIQERYHLVNQDYQEIQSELKKIAKEEKTLSLQLEDRQAQVEFQLYKMGEKNFEEYFKKHETLFESVKKTYGKKVAEKMKTDQKKEFTDMTVEQYRGRIKNLKDKNTLIHDLQKEIELLQTKKDNVISAAIGKAEQRVQQQQMVANQAKTDLNKVDRQIRELQNQIDAIIHQKDSEIKKGLLHLYKLRKYEALKEKEM